MNSITMQLQADKLIRMALEEDITSEDVSTNAVMPTKVQGTVDLIAKEDGVIAGMDVYARVFKLLDEDTEIEMFCHDGDEVREGDLMAKAYAPFVRKIEIETETLEQVVEAVEAGADIIMLDNMTPEVMKQAVALIDGRAQTECSGNITKENIARICEIGVDFVSSGALTHSAPILDISMKHLHAV